MCPIAVHAQDLVSTGKVRSKAQPRVGIVLAFTGHYNSVRLLCRFLELAGLKVHKSRITTPRIVEAGTTFASAEFCIPLRVYVGHVYHLIKEHPDLDYIVAPNLLSEDGISSTCSKYRDLGGVAIRSLGDSVGYLLKQSGVQERERMAHLVGRQTVDQRVEKSIHLPTFIMPNIRSLEKKEMRNVCYNVYADIMGWPKAAKATLLLGEGLRSKVARGVSKVEAAFAKAYKEIVEHQQSRVEVLLADQSKPRLALVGRRYLVHDPALTADLKLWFQKRGVAVITASDIPYDELRRSYVEADGYYDTHKEGHALIDWGLDKVDGFVSAGSFGCHPDAFQIDYLAEYARSRGAPCWTFRYDESAGSAGFHTRYETILAFLEQRRDQRLAAGDAPAAASPGADVAVRKRVSGRPGHFTEEDRAVARPAVRPNKPLIVWPYMGEVLNLLVEEACHQLGLQDYAFPPPPLSEESIALGNNLYTESCSPYACSTGTLKQSLRDALRKLEEEALREGRPVEPRRVIMLTARGEGPCTFGWYAIVQNKHIPEEFAPDLARHGHTIEMATMGLDGVTDFIRDLCEIGNRERLRPILAYIQAWERGLDKLPAWQRTRLRLGLFSTINTLTRPVWAKLDAAENLRARTLILRAHELEPGTTTAAYRRALRILRGAHTVEAVREAHREGIAVLEAVPRDDKIKPRVVSVGEIYVALTSFGNRGTIENLLAREGIEVVEGLTLGGFIRNSLQEMNRRSRRNHPLLRPILKFLEERNVYLLQQRVRAKEARPFIVHEVGGEGLPTVGHARHYVEEGVDGVIHIYPFKCMPEGIAKDALKELADLYGVRYLSLSFDKETEVERLRTEVSTFATLLHAQVAQMGGHRPAAYWENKRYEISRRQAIGRALNALYDDYRRPRHVD